MLVTLWIASVALLAYAAEDPFVRVEEGLLRGKWMTSKSGRDFLGFLKVPYAQPPLGDLRFEVANNKINSHTWPDGILSELIQKRRTSEQYMMPTVTYIWETWKPPQDPSHWEGARDATKDGVICPQRNVYVKSLFFLSGEEDCLYLNVYTPKVNVTDGLLPVMVFLHGGGWVTGSGNSKYYPPEYLLDKDIVLVSIEYRLGPLGFLSLENEELPGNMGLKDQNQALKWLQRNIKSFGGNPDSLTIFGESAGGASVHYHMISPMSQGLFHRAISQSGTGLCSWALGDEGVTRNNTIKLAKVLGCPHFSTKDMLKCLRSKPFGDIITTDIEFMVWNKDPMIPFKPVVEKSGGFLPEHPEKAIKSGKIATVPWMTGVNSGEGALGVAAFYDDRKLVEEFDQKFNELVPMIFFLHREKGLDLPEAARQIRRFYLGGSHVDNSTVTNIVNLYTDAWFLAGADEAVRLMREYGKAPVYYYYFSYRGTASFSSIFGQSKQDFGVCHADELIYLFPMGRLFPELQFTEKDEKFMDIFVELWTNFAKTGEPTSDLIEKRWEPVTSENLEYLHLGPEGVVMETNLLRERTSFWSILKNSKNLRVRDEL